MKFCKPAYLCLFLVMLQASCWSQDYIYKHYGLQDGLANLTIHCIFQDKDGFLWIGTESGLCRYDGHQFKTFTVKDGLPGNEVFNLYQDSKDRIWLKLFKKDLAYIYHGKIYTSQTDTLLKKIRLQTRLMSIVEDKNGNLVFCDAQNIYILSPAGEIIYHLRLHNSNTNAINISLHTDNKGEIILCTSNSLYAIHNGQLRLLKSFSLIGGEQAGENEILANPNYVVVQTGPAERTIWLKDTAITFDPHSFPYKYSAITDSLLSVNTADGALLINTRNYSQQKILPGIKVSNISIDREKNLWIGTISDGLYKISSQQMANKKMENHWNDVSYIAKEKGRLFVSNSNMGLYEFSNDTFIPKPIKRRGHPSKIFYYTKLNDQRYMIAHSMGFEIYHNDVLANERIIHVLKSVSPATEGYVWVSSNPGLLLLRMKDLAIIDTIWKQRTYSSLQVNDIIYIGTVNGLFIVKKERDRYQLTDSLFPSSIINNIGQTTDGLVWVSTFDNGLYCLRNGKLVRHFTDNMELPSDNIRSIHIDSNIVWAGTDKGVVKIMPGHRDYEFRRYSTSDGLPSDIINSIYVDSTVVYLGTPEGLCYFDETKIETSSICNLVLTGVIIGGKPADTGTRFSLNRDQRFSIEFSGISLRSEREMKYRYKIIGIHDDWQTTRQSSLEFASLPYGDLELVIVAINKFGKESSPLTLQLHIRRPFHKTTGFILSIIVVPVFILLFLYSRRMNLQKQKQVQKLRQEIKILELEQMALRAQMNPHFIFNCLNTIQQLVAEKDTATTHRFIASFAELVRQTLDNAPELFIPLEHEIKFLSNYLELERVRLEDRFSYAIDTNGIHDSLQYFVPNMVIQPYVENAIKHGIRYKKGAPGLIEIKFEQHNGILRCSITDDGVGREHAARMQKTMGSHHVSRAMDITGKRIRSLNALTSGNISITIEDLQNEKQVASGTRVIIDFYKTDNRHDKNSNNR